MRLPEFLLVPLMEAFDWFEVGLHAYLTQAGWPEVSRSQTIVLITVASGIDRPAEIARQLGITRQSVGETLAELSRLGLIELVADPNDRRAKVVRISDLGEKRRVDSRAAILAITQELERRIGKRRVAAISEAMAQDWGSPVTTFDSVTSHAPGPSS